MRIDQLMSRDVHFCTPDETLASAAGLMWNYDCGCVPVCGSDQTPEVVGMITDRDICMAALFQGKPLGELRIADAMRRDVKTCRPTDRPAEVERLMRDHQIRRVPVTDRAGWLVGIVSLADLARDGGQLEASPTEIAATLAAISEPSRSRRAA
jgi:CBS domain-containing protein